jgi:hypothetical protein
LQLRLKNASESPSIQEDKKIKTNDQSTSNSDIPTGSDELPLKNLWDVCLTDPENPEETAMELARDSRSPPP